MIIRIFNSLLFLALLLQANVSIKAPSKFTIGDPLRFSIEASGKNIIFPDINEIEGFTVQKSGSSNQISIINGKRSKKIIKSFSIYPNKSIVLPAFKVIINGKEYFTKSKKILLQKVSKTKSNLFDLTLKTDKKQMYVGESCLLTLIFKYRRDAKIVDLQMTTPSFENFWAKQLKNAKKYDQGNFAIQELQYILFPQKSGKLTLNPISINVSLMDMNANNYSFFGTNTKVKRIYSNAINFEIKELPNNVNLIGDFKIASKVDKQHLKHGEAVSFQIKITGVGNIDDIDDVKLNIPDVTIYENKADKKYNFINGKYGGSYKKSFSIVSEHSFTIPSVEIKYFDKKTKATKTIKSKVYDIEVISTKKDPAKLQLQTKTKPVKIKTKEIVKVIKTTDSQKGMFFIFGLIAGILTVVLYLYFTKLTVSRKKRETPLKKSIQKSKTADELLKTLVAYVNIDRDLDRLIFEIEQNADTDLKIKKKEILKIVESLEN